MIFLGDTHGNVNFCEKLANQNPHDIILQLGDFGVGFMPTDFINQILPKNFKFFVGNHDNRAESRKIPNCLGDFGEFGGVFFISGANSIDKDRRTIGINWWPDEELNWAQTRDCLDLWEKSKCRVLVSHDGPQELIRGLYGIQDVSHTRRMLQEIWDIRKPDVWIFGHHHKQNRGKVQGVEFYSLGIDEVLNLPDF
jgi:predicted phosphodiesterase